MVVISTVDLDAAMHSVRLHGNWYFLTKSMTREQKEAAADAVCRHIARREAVDPDEGLSAPDDRSLRWWRPEFAINSRGVEVYRITPITRVRVHTGNGVVEAAVVRKNPPSLLLESTAGKRFVADLEDVVELLSGLAAATR